MAIIENIKRKVTLTLDDDEIRLINNLVLTAVEDGKIEDKEDQTRAWDLHAVLNNIR